MSACGFLSLFLLQVCSQSMTVGTVHLTFTLPSAVASLVYGSPWPDPLMTIGGTVSRPSIWPFPNICPSRPSSSSLTTFHPLHHALALLFGTLYNMALPLHQSHWSPLFFIVNHPPFPSIMLQPCYLTVIHSIVLLEGFAAIRTMGMSTVVYRLI